MKKIGFFFAGIFLAVSMNAQQPGDTIKVKTFKYGSSTRDTAILFPPGNLTYEKIIMKYNMRCKNALVSNGTQTEQGCGQWDYSCNTYIIDSTKIEQDLNTHASHVISNFSGNTFVYTSQTIYDYYNFSQNPVVLNTVISENQYTVGTGTTPAPNLLKSNERSGHSQVLFTAAELTTAGLTAGNINGFLLSVANAGGGVNFFKVGMQHTGATVLDANAPTLTGFTNVYNSNYAFATGSNRLQFYTPFVWNGTSNILVDFSFTNTNPGNPIVFNGSTAASVLSIYARNNYALDLGSYGHVVLNPTMLTSISNEISVVFWAYGNAAAMPGPNNFLFGYDSNPNNRQLSLQMPWSDNNMYYDCGFSNNGYDRVSKTMVAAEQGGQWNHWAFTKNAVTGNMKIYLNGALWASGTGKTKMITLLNLILGKDQALQNNYKGKTNELSIWNKELAMTDIQNWMNKPLNNTHPYYANLVAYYKMDEGTGLNITDSKNNLVSNGVNLQWTYDRGQNLTHMFTETNVRPNVAFVRGTYSITTSTVVVKDSVARNPNIVQQYTVVNNAAQGPFVNDAVNVISTTNLYQTIPSNIYDGASGILTGTLAVAPQGTINITNLPYYNRYPFYNEIMSFVTPYGINLDMGPQGKSWYYDVTDFTPVLKGRKRMLMTLGGENQEQMDIDFWFIVGTPPKNVLEFNQLWQGAGRAGGAPIGNINNDTRFPPVNVPMLANGQSFKLRSTITGHGVQGEFSQNGGLITHFFNVNGGPNEFSWNITQVCSMNPVYPQGGTWLYPRQGWCPGMSSLLKEYDLTPYITPGTNATLDYNTSNPPVSNGDYRYIVADQVITYGGANHSLDACIVDVLAPSNKVLYSRTNPICANPVILVRNTGSAALTSLDIDYWVNSAGTHQTFSWAGNLAFMDTVSITLPIANLWYNGLQTSGNIFNAQVMKANGVVDDYSFNNMYHSPFTVPDVVPGKFTVEIKTNNVYAQNTYTLFDDAGNNIGNSNFSAANTVYADNYNLNGCYTLIIDDSGGDGLQWFANTAQGAGYARVKDINGTIIKSFNPDFGSRIVYSFTTDSPLSLEKNTFSASLNLYPNPSHNKFMMEGDGLERASIGVTDLLGRSVEVPLTKNKNAVEFNTTALSPGAYFVTINMSGKSAVKKIIVY